MFQKKHLDAPLSYRQRDIVVKIISFYVCMAPKKGLPWSKRGKCVVDNDHYYMQISLLD